MTWNSNDIDHIDDLLNRSREQGDPVTDQRFETPEQREAFQFIFYLREASRRNDLQDRLAMMRSLDNQIPPVSNTGAAVESIDKSEPLGPADAKGKGKVVRIGYRQIIAAAAVILLGVIAIWWLLPTSEFVLSNDSALAMNYTDYIIHPGADHDSEEQAKLEQVRDRAYHNFEMRKCRSAIPDLEYVLEHETDEEYRRITMFYLVVSYYAINKKATAQDLYNANVEYFTPAQREKLETLIN